MEYCLPPCYTSTLFHYYNIMNSHIMKLGMLAILPFMLSACGQANTTPHKKNINMNAKDYTEGKDYETYKRVRISDQNGFSQPVEVVSFLLPASWQVQGGVNWNAGTRCFSDMVQLSLQAKSKDGQYELTIFPTTQFDWINNPQMMQALRNGHIGLGCHIAQTVNAAQYIQTAIAPYVQAQVQSVKPIEAIEANLRRQAAQMNSAQQQYGNSVTNNPSAAEGVLKFPDGREGLALCVINQNATHMPDMVFGQGSITHYQTIVTMRVVFKFPAGQEKRARQIISAIQSSERANPVWTNAVQNFFTQLQRGYLDATAKQIEINNRTQQEISNNIIRSWEARNQSRDRTSQMWSEYMRGVETWKDGSGNTIELSSGYSNAWQKADGSYLLSNDPSFDPNVAFGETWTPLSK